jgi:hypothetical protein
MTRVVDILGNDVALFALDSLGDLSILHMRLMGADAYLASIFRPV